MTTRILLADDHRIVRDGLCSLLEKEKDVEIVGQAENGREAVKLAQTRNPGLILMDISMPELNGIHATRQILADNPAIKVMALSMHAEKRLVVETLKAGVSGFLLKDCAFMELTEAIRMVMSGGSYMSKGIATMILDESSWDSQKVAKSSEPVLTRRQGEILGHIADGRSAKQIAECLGLSFNTVETHRKQIKKKLNIHSTAELTKYAIREGITSV